MRTARMLPYRLALSICLSELLDGMLLANQERGVGVRTLPAVAKKMWTNAQATVGGRAFVAPVGGLIHCRDVAKYEVQLPARR